MYISGTVHGNERVGPNASIELIRLFLRNIENEWIKFLLQTRYIVITPMTNPNGYDKNKREELIKDNYSRDINRDFPYLVNPSECMTTVAGRVVNELYINHLFQLALTLHGGTESLTYPYGAPNHLEGTRKPKSTEAPDFIALKTISNTVSLSSADKQNVYITGDMSSVVYPVNGGMEDWAYAGSWEGVPVITEPCTPTTYTNYKPDKTIYSKNYKDALKSIMFLLEISHDKTPTIDKLGRRSEKNQDNCLLNIRENAFNDNIDADTRKFCLNKNNDGYINRVVRLSLTMIDMLQPYIRAHVNNLEKFYTDGIDVEWAIGGATTTDKTWVLYDFFDENDKKISELYDLIKRSETNYVPIEEFQKLLPLSSKELSGKAIWDVSYYSHDKFKIKIKNDNSGKLAVLDKKVVALIVFANVDKEWLKQENPLPSVGPQTHVVNARNKPNYYAKNGEFYIQGSDYFKSDLILNTMRR